MRPHRSYEPLPKFGATLCVQAFVSHDGKFARARGDQDQDPIPLLCFPHPELLEFFLRQIERIALHFSALDKNQTYLVHCAAGVRSATACAKMSRLKFSNLYNLEGGLKAWEKAGKPVEK